LRRGASFRSKDTLATQRSIAVLVAIVDRNSAPGRVSWDVDFFILSQSSEHLAERS